MRKIDKSKRLASEYYEWQQSSEAKEKSYVSKGKYYIDIIANLLQIQEGVCAYTEKFLCDSEKFETKNWRKGRFNEQMSKSELGCLGNLDHFDSTKKTKEPWSWDNFFYIDTDVNNFKGNKRIDDILKPDSKDYNPNVFLEYDINEHIFIANTDLEDDIQLRVNDMIKTLGINYVKDDRQKYIDEKIIDIEIEIRTKEETNLYQYFTAFKMYFLKKTQQ